MKPAEHRFLRFILPRRWFEAVRDGTRLWLIECRCGFTRDLWDAGGVRYKAAGEPRHYRKCAECSTWNWHKVRKKTEEEKRTLGR